MKIKNRLRFVLFAIVLVVLGGSAGYYAIYQANHSFLDCMYMTVISLTSVGYGEVIEVTGNPGAQIFTMILITFGLGIIMYGISTLTAMIVEGEVSGILRRRQMEKRIARLSDHFIVCGAGKTGRHVIQELVTNQEKTVLIDTDQDNINQCLSLGDIPFILGDATDDANLILAGIERARGIVISLPSDKDTVYATMSTRMLNKKARIISRMVDPKLEPKLYKAGADAVVSPNFIGGLRMASELIRPAAVSFLDKMLRSAKGTLRIHEITVGGGSSMLDKSIMHSGLKDKFGLMVLGARQKGGQDIIFNPPPSMPLSSGTTLVVMGDVDQIAKAREA